ncbi:hypothetical protein [Altibacter sp. HG106]|uniref:hypothetical protein n=1 Tax=Altibacter sp. HG106 TaxID=3023937 RepID=UPI0023507277|nr:hypothetical protein [Altibacter sp. HG106]MDC7995266.1 hypothetical protein [Altibacter sp. HG106]
MTKRPKDTSSGCMWPLLVCIFTLLLFTAFRGFIQLSWMLALPLALVLSVLLTRLLLGAPSTRRLFANAVIILMVFAGVYWGFQQILGILRTLHVTQNETFNAEEAVAPSQLVIDNDTIVVYESHRYWTDNYGNNYNGYLRVREADYLALRNHIANYRIPPGNFWGNLYDYIDRTDSPKLDLLLQTFQEVGNTYRLNPREFAEMVVSCVQDIPYSFVFEEACLPPQRYESSIRKILLECPECCIGNIPYGIQNPVSFIQNLKGDCDTRTVLIYSILKHFNYDVAILNSDFYRHSIIGLNLPGSGKHKVHNGKRYYVWETTAPYFELGSLPYNFNDITHWDVILTSK